MRYITIFTFLVFCSTTLRAQVPAPADAQEEPIALIGATIHTGNGEVIENGMIVFENGKITQVSKQDEAPVNDRYRNIYVEGKHIYPGLIAASTYLGISEIDAVRATRDFSETGSVNPNVRSIIAYNTDSRVTPTVRNNGVLIAEVQPRNGLISGTSSIVQLDAWNWEDAVYKKDFAITLNWPSMYSRTGWWGEPGPIEANKKYDENVEKIFSFFREAEAYSKNVEPKQKNLRFESMRGLFDKSKKLFIYANSARQIMAVIDFKKKFPLDIAITGGKDAWMLTDLLKEYSIPVILDATHNLPSRHEDDIDIVYRTPKILQDAGVQYCITMSENWKTRNLPFQAGSAAQYGLTKEEALMTITKYPAEILGIAETLGTLEKGKDATLIVSEGDILDMRTSKLTNAFIGGREIDLKDKQWQLYNKYKTKYEKQK